MCIYGNAYKRRGYQSVSSDQISPYSIIQKSNFKMRQILRPKMLIILSLFFCWSLRNSLVVAAHQPLVGNNDLTNSNYYHQTRSYRENFPSHVPTNVRLRAPPSLTQFSQLAASDGVTSSVVPLGGTGLAPLSDESAIIPVMVRSPPFLLNSLPIAEPKEMEISGPRRKKNCEPSIATRGLLGPTMKRSFFAYSEDEMQQKVRDDEYRQSMDRKKRAIQHSQLSGQEMKRNAAGTGTAAGTAAELQDSPLPWTCETKYDWKDMGSNHYPRFVRTAECKTRHCFNGFFRCRPRRYKTKVLKRVTTDDSTSCEDDDVSLPEALRNNWKFITVTINLCCDCTGRNSPTTEG